MKKILLYILLAATLLLPAGCSDKYAQDNPDPGKEFITFNLPVGIAQKKTYADPVASDEENAVEMLHIYMFDDASGILEKVFRIDDTGIGGSGTSRTATVDVTGSSGKKLFYFVANGDGKISGLDKANVGETTRNEFVETLSDRDRSFVKPKLLFSGYTEVADITSPQATELIIGMRRRVARFDVVNDKAITHLIIDKILISQTSQHAYIFSDATGTPQQEVKLYDLPELLFSDIENSNEGETPSVFYLYPTTLGDGKTQISFEASFRGSTQVYNLHLDDDVEIKPNARYIIKPKLVGINNIQFEISIANWDEGDEYTAEPGTDDIDVSDFVLVSGDGKLNGNDYDVTLAKKESVLRFTVKSYTKAKADVFIHYKKGDKSILPNFEINDPEPILTYGAYYIQNFELKVPAPTQQKMLDITVEIVNKAVPEQRKEFKIIDKAVTFSGLTIANGNGSISGDKYNITTMTSNSILRFTVDSYTDNPATAVITYSKGNKNFMSTFGVDKPTPVKIGENLYRQTFQITVPVPTKHRELDARITVASGFNSNQKKVFSVIDDFYYPNTTMKPALFQGTYWAPVNVGASGNGTGTGVIHDGLLYQWGRKSPGFVYNSTNDTQTGSVNYDTGISSNKFYINGTNGDWINPRNDNLWNTTDPNGPCPKGWRLPTDDEAKKLREKFNFASGDRTKWNATYKALEVIGDRTIYLPAAGYRPFNNNGVYTQIDQTGYYWTKTFNNVYAFPFYFNSSNVYNSSNHQRGYGFSVRCVQE